MHNSRSDGLVLIFFFLHHVALWFVQNIAHPFVAHPASPSLHLVKTLIKSVEVQSEKTVK